MERRSVWYGFVIFFLCLYFLQPAKKVLAVTKVYTGGQFRQVMGRTGKERVELCVDLSIDGPITIRGEKEVDGGGHHLVRSKKGNRIYGGSLFLIQGGSCTWGDVTISGGGKSRELSGKVFGRLIEVRQGNLTLEKGCILRDNINDALAVDGGGALLVGAGGICRMEGGVICGNKNMSKGAGVVVEREGKFIMTGGEIRENKVMGSGVIEGFDGRGGALYAEGHIVIRGGLIRGNTACAYKKGEVHYGGVGAALYAAAGSVVQIEGGAFVDNQDDGECPIRISGQILLGGEPVLQKIYLEKKSVIQSKQSFRPKSAIVVQPAVYASGICIAKGREAPFKLIPKKGYNLKKKSSGYYISKNRTAKQKKIPKKKKQAHQKKKQLERNETKRKQSKRDSISKERAAPAIDARESAFIFYVGEKVEKEVLLSGVRATDQKEGDITKKVQVVSPRHISTDRIRTGSILYEVENGQGIRTRKKGRYRVVKNHSPTIHIVPRFLFLWEVAGFTKQQWKELLLEEVNMRDDCENRSELYESTEVEYKNLVDMTAGYHEVTVKIRDQFGHRFYMKPGEKRRYGEGNEIVVKIPVTLVDAAELGKENEIGVRFLEPDSENTVEEEWTFTCGEIREIQDFMDAREDPFNTETNQAFLERFGKCRNDEEDIGYE